MKHVRNKVDMPDHFQNRTAEERKAVALRKAVPVNGPDGKHLLIVDEIIGDVAKLQGINAAVLGFLPEQDLEIAYVLHSQDILPVYDGILRKHDPRILSFFDQFHRKRSDHIRQTACFDEWNAFASGKQDLH